MVLRYRKRMVAPWKLKIVHFRQFVHPARKKNFLVIFLERKYFRYFYGRVFSLLVISDRGEERERGGNFIDFSPWTCFCLKILYYIFVVLFSGENTTTQIVNVEQEMNLVHNIFSIKFRGKFSDVKKYNPPIDHCFFVGRWGFHIQHVFLVAFSHPKPHPGGITTIMYIIYYLLFIICYYYLIFAIYYLLFTSWGPRSLRFTFCLNCSANYSTAYYTFASYSFAYYSFYKLLFLHTVLLHIVLLLFFCNSLVGSVRYVLRGNVRHVLYWDNSLVGSVRHVLNSWVIYSWEVCVMYSSWVRCIMCCTRG